MEDLKQYYLFGEVACRLYASEDFDEFMATVINNKWHHPDMDIYLHDDSLQNAEDVLQAYDGYMGYAMITKSEYDEIHEYMHPKPMMATQGITAGHKDIIHEALEMLDANMNNLLKVGVECDLDKMELLRYDIRQLKGVMNKGYKLEVTMTEAQKKSFSDSHGVDFPEYTD